MNETSYTKLFTVQYTNETGPNSYIALSSGGSPLYVVEALASVSACQHMEISAYRLSHEEFRAYAEKARRNGKLQKAIRKGLITEAQIEALCK